MTVTSEHWLLCRPDVILVPHRSSYSAQSASERSGYTSLKGMVVVQFFWHVAAFYDTTEAETFLTEMDEQNFP